MKADRLLVVKIEQIREDLRECSFFTIFDLILVCCKIPMSKDFKNLATFKCKFGAYKIDFMPFSLVSAQATFQRVIDETLKD